MNIQNIIESKVGTQSDTPFFTSTLNADDCIPGIDAAVVDTTEATGGYKALGYIEDKCVIYSYSRKSIFEIAPANIYNPAFLNSVLGVAHVYATYKGFDLDTGEDTPPNYNAIGRAIQAECDTAGFYNPETVRGAGVWLQNEDLIINGTKLFSTGLEINRTNGKFVYAQSVDIGLDACTVAASPAEVSYALEALNTWSWKRGSDATLMLGWIGTAYLAGALQWRTHASLTGPRGSGKSTLDDFAMALLGENYALKVDGGTTEAGIRQSLKHDARALIIDESEADGHQIGKHFDMLRSASSGSKIVKGGQGGKATTYEIRCSALVSGIKPPVFSAADASRFLPLHLVPLSANAERNVHPLLSNSNAARKALKKLGSGMFARVVASHGRFLDACDLVRQVILDNGLGARFSDTFGSPIAAAWVMLNDGAMTSTDAVQWFNTFDLSVAIDRTQGIDDAQEMLDHLLATAVNVQGNRISISELVASSAMSKKGPFRDVLLSYGIRSDVDKSGNVLMHIVAKNPELSKLFAGSQFANARVEDMLERVKGATKGAKVRFGAKSERPVTIPLTDIITIDRDTFETTQVALSQVCENLDFGM